MPIELTPLEGEDRRQVVEGLKKCIEAYPELKEYVLERARQEDLTVEIALVTRRFERKLGRPLTDQERATLGMKYERAGLAVVAGLVVDGTADDIVAWLGKGAQR